MSYERLYKNRRSITENPVVTIGSGGVVYLNTFLMRNYFQKIEWVVLFYDKSRNSLGIQPCNKGEEGSFRLNFSAVKSKSTGVVAARSVIKALGIDYSKTKQFKGKWNEKEKMLEVQL